MLSLRDLKGSLKGEIGIDISVYINIDTDLDVDVDIEVHVDVDGHFGCVKGFSTSVQVLLYGIEAIMVLTLIIRK